ncbi:MAG: hypothetical protein GX558_04120 [Clostridiales bacterium]|nr:hypothetical protein [Clostridiales bacterium]
MKSRKWVDKKAVIAMVSAVALLLALYSTSQAARIGTLENQVSANYQKAFYEVVDLMGGVEVNLEKLLITMSAPQQQELLSAIARQADGALADLAALPSDEATLLGTIKFVNQAGDFAATVSARIASGGELTDDDRLTVETLYTSAVSLNQQLAMMADEVRGGRPLTAYLSLEPAPVPTGDTTQADQTATYPVLLYDGPFSDGREDVPFAALGATEVDGVRAQSIAEEFIGADRIQSIRPTGEAAVPVDCHTFDAQTADGTLSIAVTKRGGQVLYLLTSQGASQPTLSEAQCADLAAQFLKSQGLEGMQVNYWQRADGLITFNFAATQDGVVLYPDLIKVQISAESGRVTGYESRNYLTNHIVRALGTPTLTQQQANLRVSSRLAVERARLCVIPLAVGEAFCYEFSARLGDAQYLIYIDAYSGQERALLKVVTDSEGQLTI